MLLLAAAAESISVDHIHASSGWLAPGSRQQHRLSKVQETMVDLRAGAGKLSPLFVRYCIFDSRHAFLSSSQERFERKQKG
jgi:hypothetical protein